MTPTEKLYAWIKASRPDLHQQLSAAPPSGRVDLLEREARVVIGDADQIPVCAGNILALLQMKADVMAVSAGGTAS